MTGRVVDQGRDTENVLQCPTSRFGRPCRESNPDQTSVEPERVYRIGTATAVVVRRQSGSRDRRPWQVGRGSCRRSPRGR